MFEDTDALDEPRRSSLTDFDDAAIDEPSIAPIVECGDEPIRVPDSEGYSDIESSDVEDSVKGVDVSDHDFYTPPQLSTPDIPESTLVESTSKLALAPSHPADRAFISKSELVIGIDFGTTFSGIAYSLSTRESKHTKGRSSIDQLKVNIYKDWHSENGQHAEKTPTIIAYEDGEVSAWGGDVRLDVEPPDFIRYFKLGLCPQAKEHYRQFQGAYRANSLPEQDWTRSSLPGKEPVDHVADYLACLRDHCLSEVLPNHYGREFLEKQKITYSLTVPAIWNDKAKDLMRKAALRAGIPGDGLVLVTEPEAAALYCATKCEEVDLRTGDCFVVCDAGGGTVVCEARKRRSK